MKIKRFLPITFSTVFFLAAFLVFAVPLFGIPMMEERPRTRSTDEEKSSKEETTQAACKAMTERNLSEQASRGTTLAVADQNAAEDEVGEDNENQYNESEALLNTMELQRSQSVSDLKSLSDLNKASSSDKASTAVNQLAQKATKGTLQGVPITIGEITLPGVPGHDIRLSQQPSQLSAAANTTIHDALKDFDLNQLPSLDEIRQNEEIFYGNRSTIVPAMAASAALTSADASLSQANITSKQPQKSNRQALNLLIPQEQETISNNQNPYPPVPDLIHTSVNQSSRVAVAAATAAATDNDSTTIPVAKAVATWGGAEASAPSAAYVELVEAQAVQGDFNEVWGEKPSLKTIAGDAGIPSSSSAAALNSTDDEERLNALIQDTQDKLQQMISDNNEEAARYYKSALSSYQEALRPRKKVSGPVALELREGVNVSVQDVLPKLLEYVGNADRIAGNMKSQGRNNGLPYLRQAKEVYEKAIALANGGEFTPEITYHSRRAQALVFAALARVEERDDAVKAFMEAALCAWSCLDAYKHPRTLHRQNPYDAFAKKGNYLLDLGLSLKRNASKEECDHYQSAVNYCDEAIKIRQEGPWCDIFTLPIDPRYPDSYEWSKRHYTSLINAAERQSNAAFAKKNEDKYDYQNFKKITDSDARVIQAQKQEWGCSIM